MKTLPLAFEGEQTFDGTVIKERNELRKRLHKAIRSRVYNWNWIPTDENVEKVKRTFLWIEFKVETSRSLDNEALKEAIGKAKNYDREKMIEHMDKRYKDFHPNQFRRATLPQQGKLKRIMFYVIKMKDDAAITYIEETIGRKTDINNLSINEANQVIRRVEKWEARILTGKSL